MRVIAIIAALALGALAFAAAEGAKPDNLSRLMEAVYMAGKLDMRIADLTTQRDALTMRIEAETADRAKINKLIVNLEAELRAGDGDEPTTGTASGDDPTTGGMQ